MDERELLEFVWEYETDDIETKDIDFVKIDSVGEYGYINLNTSERERKWKLKGNKLYIYDQSDNITCELSYDNNIWSDSRVKLSKKEKKSIEPETKHKIGFLVIAIGEKYRSKLRKSIENKRQYCEKHGYEFILVGGERERRQHPAWSKITKTLKYMDEFDYLFVCDLDTYIMNDNVKVESFISLMAQKDMLICEETSYVIDNRKNTGVFVVKNTPFIRELFIKIYEHKDIVNEPTWEQACLNYICKKKLVDNSRIEVIHNMRIMNSFEKDYITGDFLVHFACVRNLDKLEDKIELFNRKINTINTI